MEVWTNTCIEATLVRSFCFCNNMRENLCSLTHENSLMLLVTFSSIVMCLIELWVKIIISEIWQLIVLLILQELNWLSTRILTRLLTCLINFQLIFKANRLSNLNFTIFMFEFLQPQSLSSDLIWIVFLMQLNTSCKQ